jgi:hypothetical protein
MSKPPSTPVGTVVAAPSVRSAPRTAAVSRPKPYTIDELRALSTGRGRLDWQCSRRPISTR